MSLQKSQDNLRRFLGDYRRKEQVSLSMHASESPMSPATKAALAHDLSCRYSSDDPGDILVHGDMIFGGASSFKLLKEICSTELQSLLDATYVSFVPLSGLNAADITIASFTVPGDTILIVSKKHGGHPVFPALAQSYSLKHHSIPFHEHKMDIDWNELSAVLSDLKPALLYFDASDFLFPFDFSSFSKPRNINTVCVFDVSHVLGVLGARQMSNPLDFQFDAIVGSTHKSFPGPHKGVFATRDARLIQQFEKVSKVKVSSTHSHHILALTVALLEFREQGRGYIDQMIDNGNVFGRALEDGGLDPYQKSGRYTATHQVWLPFADYDTAIKAYRRLEKVGIYANFIKLHYGIGWGVRFGMQEMTFRGFKSDGTKKLASIVSQACLMTESVEKLRRDLLGLLAELVPCWRSTPAVYTMLQMKEQQ